MLKGVLGWGIRPPHLCIRSTSDWKKQIRESEETRLNQASSEP